MRLVVADTSPLNYLILIGHANLLPSLFQKVVLPAIVHDELTSSKTPPLVRHWISNLPAWLEVPDGPVCEVEDTSLKGIDAGEKAAIQLAASLHADLLLMDDRNGVNAALRKGLRVTGTLGILDLAARRGLANFAQAVEQLRQTNFRAPRTLLDAPLEIHNEERRTGVKQVLTSCPVLWQGSAWSQVGASAVDTSKHLRANHRRYSSHNAYECQWALCKTIQ